MPDLFRHPERLAALREDRAHHPCAAQGVPWRAGPALLAIPLFPVRRQPRPGPLR
ncbi:hypothetical protein AB0D34_17185 [Streptomyces sp. NPDC048420]|uniref:hypothetical protein n=1 Tax=Streptomyces sp. NPDC048420 TaxID=3155755 RepID=UPI0034142402